MSCARARLEELLALTRLEDCRPGDSDVTIRNVREVLSLVRIIFTY